MERSRYAGQDTRTRIYCHALVIGLCAGGRIHLRSLKRRVIYISYKINPHQFIWPSLVFLGSGDTLCFENDLNPLGTFLGTFATFVASEDHKTFLVVDWACSAYPAYWACLASKRQQIPSLFLNSLEVSVQKLDVEHQLFYRLLWESVVPYLAFSWPFFWSYQHPFQLFQFYHSFSHLVYRWSSFMIYTQLVEDPRLLSSLVNLESAHDQRSIKYSVDDHRCLKWWSQQESLQNKRNRHILHKPNASDSCFGCPVTLRHQWTSHLDRSSCGLFHSRLKLFLFSYLFSKLPCGEQFC